MNSGILHQETTITPEVSVVMINYNGRPWLDLALESVLTTEGVAIEVVVVDDFSSDGSRDFLSVKAASDARIRPYFLEYNTGISEARNKGIEIARAAYISIMDSDDRFLPCTVKKQLEAFIRLQNQTPELSMLTSDAWLINEEGQRKGRYISREWWNRETSKNPPIWTLPSTFFFRKDRSAKFHPAYRSADAPIFISRMREIGPIGFVGEPLIEYRLRMSSVTNAKGAHMLREMHAASRSVAMGRINNPLSADEVSPPGWRETAAWVYGRNAKNAAANDKIFQAAFSVIRAVAADPAKTWSKMIRAYQTLGKKTL
jgi:glycosyltransferase involved in cell wall biosynthesis